MNGILINSNFNFLFLTYTKFYSVILLLSILAIPIPCYKDGDIQPDVVIPIYSSF